MYYGEIKNCDIANGEGVRVTLFVSGCTNRCPDCFQPQTWDFDYGKEFTEDTKAEIFAELDKPFVNGLTVLGGEPFEPSNQQALLPLLRKVRKSYPEKTIWCYTGYDFEQDLLTGRLCDWPVTEEMLSYIDVLVDGEFKLNLKNPNLRFRGSSNQRVIDLKKSLYGDELVLWSEAY